jgi:hypothetical protein
MHAPYDRGAIAGGGRVRDGIAEERSSHPSSDITQAELLEGPWASHASRQPVANGPSLSTSRRCLSSALRASDCLQEQEQRDPASGSDAC